MKPGELHQSHVTRVSLDASTFDEICINCRHTDIAGGGWGKLAEPCPNPVGSGGMTIEEWRIEEQARIERARREIPAAT